MKNFDELLLSYKDEFLKDLDELISIQSVSAFGSEEPKRALHFMLEKAESFGLKTKNIDDIAAHVEYGDGEKICGVLTHLDVVPAKREDWSCDPFSLTQRNGRLYGRGIADDKGPALAALYCLRVLKECGVKGNRVRVIFGTSEEIGMQDMAAYFESEELPDLSFTPDSEYGICKAEKGILHLEISSPAANNTTLTQFEAGTANNVVPDTAYALVDCNEYEEHILQRLADGREGNFDLEFTIDGLKITSRGKAAHACEPEKGFNAASALVGLICAAFGYEAVGDLCAFIDFCIGSETNGRSMGIKMRDCVSGELTLTLSRVSIVENEAKAVIDVRYPVSFLEEVVLYQIKKVAAREGLTVKVIDGEKPLFLDESCDIVNVLKTAYKNVCGEEPSLYTTGGGTYARMLGGKGVAFGPVFEDDDSRIHNSDESLDEEKFFKHFRICLEAMYGMMTFDGNG
ncbi:MAG: Sapep family Mn(2+)-dependent dipeptidase [Clostridia bacterium]|nr:Sapep family Mn(2+)-dependent dipeptidase [Clostridia bacterium]